MPDAFVTTSWDDGSAEDFRIAELLTKYAIPGCFYVPRTNPERAVISERELRELASAHEIGGHTLRHLPLTSLPLDEARREIQECKHWLDDLTGRATLSFCYPCGKFAAAHVRAVAEAGFTGARTADWMCLAPGPDVYRVAPSLHLYPHSSLIHVAHCLRYRQLRELARYMRFGALTRPSQLADAMLDYVEEHGGVFHVWGHGWEIAERGLWDELEAILASIARRPRLHRVSNAGLTEHLRGASLARARV